MNCVDGTIFNQLHTTNFGIKELSMANCRQCKFSRSIPGDAHIQCSHPAIESNSLPIMLSLSMNDGHRLKDILGLSFNQHGVSNGWCNFPFNFDPIWVEGDCKLISLRVIEEAPE